ncbi:MAG: hypothetical protein AUH86_02255 [Acidobacteria bacterium 13_1_40CM_4_58_4]|nr:MAG: hypothetical protein AUH86_02255 [Acidobacteria bacterium 13_1_40CM_4_58_4]
MYSGVEYQFRMAKCSPKWFFATPAPSSWPRASSWSGARSTAFSARVADGRAGLRAASRENLSAIPAI